MENSHGIWREASSIQESTEICGGKLPPIWVSKYPPLGMIALPNSRQSRVLYGSYMTFFMNSMQSLYSKHSDMPGAALLFGRFIGVPASRPIRPIIPSIANMVSLMELWITIILAAVAKTHGILVYLPANYLAQMHFYDAICTGRFQIPAIYLTVSQTESNVSGRLKFFVDLLCASGKYSDFDVLGNALHSDECISTGEAERTLILALVMLTNLDITPDTRFGDTIRRSLHTVSIRESFPPRLRKCLQLVQGAKSKTDVTTALKNILTERQDECLYECQWQYHVQQLNGPGLKLKYSKPNTEALYKLEYGALIEKTQAEARVLHEENQVDIKERDQLLRQMANVKERERAAVTIQKRWRHHISMRPTSTVAPAGYQQQATPGVTVLPISPEREWVDETLRLFVITETSCQICNVVLTSKQQADAYQYEDAMAMEGEEYSPTTPPTATTSPGASMMLSPFQSGTQNVAQFGMLSTPTREQHEMTMLHRETCRSFKVYRDFLLKYAFPIVQDSQWCISNIGHNRDLGYYGERLSSFSAKFMETMQEVHSQRAWEKLPLVHSSLLDFAKAVSGAKQQISMLEPQSPDGTYQTALAMAPNNTPLSSVDAEILEADDDDDQRELKVTDSAQSRWNKVTNKRKNNRKGKRKDKY